MKHNFSFFYLIIFFVLSGCASTKVIRSIAVDDLPNDDQKFTRTDFMTGLDDPWDLAFLKDGTMFFTEKCKGLSVRMPNGTVNKIFGLTGNKVLASDLFCEGQSGMNGVAIDPDFTINRYVYVYMPSTLNRNPRTNHVVRLKVSEDFKSVSNRTDILKDIAFKDKDNNWGGAGTHSGGRLRFGPDGYLYITTGDNHNGTLPQDLKRLGGKVIRVDRDGKAAPGNNNVTGADPRIFTYGHRNVQGIAFRPGTGQVYISEHGPRHSDEVTMLKAGGNGGWSPAPEAGVSCEDNYCGYTSNKRDGTPTPMTDLKKFPDAMMPIWTNGGKSQGMGPCTFISGSQWKSWNGRLLVGIMGYALLEVLTLNEDGSLKTVTYPDLPRERMRSLVQGPDGNLYVATDSGNIWEITPQ